MADVAAVGVDQRPRADPGRCARAPRRAAAGGRARSGRGARCPPTGGVANQTMPCSRPQSRIGTMRGSCSAVTRSRAASTRSTGASDASRGVSTWSSTGRVSRRSRAGKLSSIVLSAGAVGRPRTARRGRGGSPAAHARPRPAPRPRRSRPRLRSGAGRAGGGQLARAQPHQPGLDRRVGLGLEVLAHERRVHARELERTDAVARGHERLDQADGRAWCSPAPRPRAGATSAPRPRDSWRAAAAAGQLPRARPRTRARGARARHPATPRTRAPARGGSRRETGRDRAGRPARARPRSTASTNSPTSLVMRSGLSWRVALPRKTSSLPTERRMAWSAW